MTITLIVFCIVNAAVCNAIMDKLQFHYTSSIFTKLNPLFWNPLNSWRNKWKDGRKANGERFFLSSTVLVAFTDAWHLFQFLQNTFIFTALAVAFGAAAGFNWVGNLSVFVVMRTIYSGVFEVAFKWVLSRSASPFSDFTDEQNSKVERKINCE